MNITTCAPSTRSFCARHRAFDRMPHDYSRTVLHREPENPNPQTIAGHPNSCLGGPAAHTHRAGDGARPLPLGRIAAVPPGGESTPALRSLRQPHRSHRPRRMGR
jgi:hypothetical protein